ncbi:hypothetical protein [Streptomyces sp. NPDC087300]|uniref:hypothetical protein n=1 Tax=Streptomyces sp. NPDC087300 TaxID=3365780 RepID=UPI0038012F20
MNAVPPKFTMPPEKADLRKAIGIRGEDSAKLAPFKHRNLNALGCYSFAAPTAAARPGRGRLDDDGVGAAE